MTEDTRKKIVKWFWILFSVPVRYSISNIPLRSVVAACDGVKRTVKTRKIGQLTDSDLYTEVTLTDVEIPIRKGPFVPVHIGRTSIMTAYPMVIRMIRALICI